MKIIVGLGNPGKRYEHTPHNVGFGTVDKLAAELDSSCRRSLRFKASVAKCSSDGEDVLLVKPQTYMNNSGESVGAIMRYRKLAPQDVVVVSDDADLELGRLRIRPSGGSGGHRGLASIIQHLSSSDFARIRIGIGRDEQTTGLVDHVLSPFSSEERKRVEQVVDRATQAVLCILAHGIDEAMNRFNGRED